jgi:hypothetical protein
MEEPKPMFGCYVVGSIWKFIALDINKTYSISQGYEALNDDIFDIFRILKNLKDIVIQRTK